jgi:hypothetical protein
MKLHDHPLLPCRNCGQPMRLTRSIPPIGGLPELNCFQCPACGNVHTETVIDVAAPRDQARPIPTS